MNVIYRVRKAVRLSPMKIYLPAVFNGIVSPGTAGKNSCRYSGHIFQTLSSLFQVRSSSWRKVLISILVTEMTRRACRISHYRAGLFQKATFHIAEGCRRHQRTSIIWCQHLLLVSSNDQLLTPPSHQIDWKPIPNIDQVLQGLRQHSHLTEWSRELSLGKGLFLYRQWLKELPRE